MMSLELSYLGLITLILWTSAHALDVKGQVIGLVVLAVTASESALGLGILVVLYNYSQDVSFNAFQILHG